MWQFMYAAEKENGLELNSYIDERMDPEKSSEAAAKYLIKLKEIYNDWILAVAAYNAGPRTISRAIIYKSCEALMAIMKMLAYRARDNLKIFKTQDSGTDSTNKVQSQEKLEENMKYLILIIN